MEPNTASSPEWHRTGGRSAARSAAVRPVSSTATFNRAATSFGPCHFDLSATVLAAAAALRTFTRTARARRCCASGAELPAVRRRETGAALLAAEVAAAAGEATAATPSAASDTEGGGAAWRRFPTDFVWGVATAAFQIEGAVAEDGRGPSIWDTFSHVKGNIYEDANADVACDHYHRYEEDLQLVKQLGAKAYRFSISWSRVLPTGVVADGVNEQGLAFYEQICRGCLARGVEPVATLYHWDLPEALEAPEQQPARAGRPAAGQLSAAELGRRGGWLKRSTVGHFGRFAQLCFERLGRYVKTWCSINEPWTQCILGYCFGSHAPGRNVKPGEEPYLAAHHMLLAHAKAQEWGRSIAHSSPKMAGEGEMSDVTEQNLGRESMALEAPEGVQIDPKTLMRIFIRRLWALLKRVGVRRGASAALAGDELSLLELAMVLNTEWPEAQEPENPEDQAAVERHKVFNLDWFARPLYDGDYPPLMRSRVGERLPRFTEAEQKSLKGSNDFFALNCYSARYICEDTAWRKWQNTAATLRILPYIADVPLQKLKAALASNKTDEGSTGEEVPVGGPAQARGLPATSWITDAGYETAVPLDAELTATGWPVAHYGLARLLLDLQRHYAPRGGIVVTEAGAAFDDDRRGAAGRRQAAYLRGQSVALRRAMAEGADVRGYFWWTLMDNFEWSFGYSKHFGLYALDVDLTRWPRAEGAEAFGRLAARQALAPEVTLEEFTRCLDRPDGKKARVVGVERGLRVGERNTVAVWHIYSSYTFKHAYF
ncbi:unnamed protein product [Durusdinium trenchii]|uniref:Beta-glucosidase n=1 Tax=Durusdinium trenchii TaxID=1381693 RepID=A0ABP0HQF0_9DINO